MNPKSSNERILLAPPCRLISISLLSAYLLRLEGNQTREAGRDKATEDWARAQTTSSQLISAPAKTTAAIINWFIISSLTPSSLSCSQRIEQEEEGEKRDKGW